MLKTYPELIRAAEGPVIDTACAALLMLARKVHQTGYKVALTGEGADEWMAGYPWYKIQRVLGAIDIIPGVPISQWARRLYLKATGSPTPPADQIRKVQEMVGGPNAWLNVYGLFGLSKIRFFSREMWEKLGDHSPFADLGLNVERAKKWHPLNRSLYVGARVMLPGLLLSCKGDRVAMNSSVETRYPFLDEDVFAFLAKLHPNWKMRRLRDKLVLRHLADRWVPKSIAWRRKAMFRAPLDGFHTTTLPTFVDQLLSPESLRKTGYFDAGSIGKWRETPQPAGFVLWTPAARSRIVRIARIIPPRRHSRMAEPLITPELQATIGQKSKPRLHEVDKLQIRMFARAVGHTDPIFYDEDAAKAAAPQPRLPARLPGHADLRPGAATDLGGRRGGTSPEPGRPLNRILNGGTEIEYFDDICAGDVLEAVELDVDIAGARRLPSARC